jgi:hypothetical protein
VLPWERLRTAPFQSLPAGVEQGGRPRKAHGEINDGSDTIDNLPSHEKALRQTHGDDPAIQQAMQRLEGQEGPAGEHR